MPSEHVESAKDSIDRAYTNQNTDRRMIGDLLRATNALVAAVQLLELKVERLEERSR